MAQNFIPGSSRGGANYDWLQTKYSFSFAQYYDPQRMGYGALRVINDDQIAPGAGFGTHPHQDMEIITIILSGTLAHKDDLGTEATIGTGEVQVMSAGTGVLHSEYNASKTESVTLLQIWIEPKSYHIKPRYDQKSFDFSLAQNKLVPLITPSGRENSLSIHQDASLLVGLFKDKHQTAYTLREGFGIYIFVIDGVINIAGQNLNSRDAFCIDSVSEVVIEVQAGTHFLLIEVPLTE